MRKSNYTGINTVTRKRADGTVTRDYYNRRTKVYLGTDRNAAIAAVAAENANATIVRSTFGAVATSYMDSTRFRRLKPRSQTTNRFYVERLRDLFGRLPAAAITRPVVVRLRESNEDRPWYGTHLLSKLRLVLQHGVDTGVLTSNVGLRPGGLRPPRRYEVWSPEQIARFLTAAPPESRLACALLIYSAQRPGDVLAMRWDQIEERDGRTWISLRQAKVGELIRVPAHRTLAALLKETPRRAPLLVPSPQGMPWSYRNFSRAWDQTQRRADYRFAREMLRAGMPKDEIRPLLLSGLQRRDLRRTAMVRMAESGATTVQIAAVSGHTIDQTSRILDTYIPRRAEIAAGAIDAWERGPMPGAEAMMPVKPTATP